METSIATENTERGSGAALFLLNNLSIGGSERKTVRVVNELYRRGCAVHLAYLAAPATLLEELSQGIPVVCLMRRGKLSLKSVRILLEYIRRHQIGTILCINLYPMIYAVLVRLLQIRNKKLRVFVAINTTEHHALKEHLSMLIYAPLLRRIELIIFGCQAQLTLWCKRYRLESKNSRVFYNGVDISRFSAMGHRSRSGRRIVDWSLNEHDVLIGIIGQLRQVKNQGELLRAFWHIKDEVPEARVVLVGDGPERNNLEKLINDLNLGSRVRLLGQVDDVYPILKSIDIFVLTSISETFSNAALEAMAMSKAVILSDTGGAREMVVDGVDGYIYAQGNVEALAGILKSLAAKNDDRLKLGDSARATVLAKFSFAEMVDLYQELLFSSWHRKSRDVIAMP